MFMISPLPKRMMKFLFDRGLSIWVLPKELERARQLLYGHLRHPRRIEAFPKQESCRIAHYNHVTKRIILPERYIYPIRHNVPIHEIGHALDHLYYGNRWLSAHPKIEPLLKDNPLDKHCARCDKETGLYLEQFATSFEAYFNEPQNNKGPYFHTIDDINPKLLRIIHDKLVEPFR